MLYVCIVTKKQTYNMIVIDDIKEGSKFTASNGLVWIVDKVYVDDVFGTAVETSIEGEGKGKYCDSIEEVVSFLNEEM